MRRARPSRWCSAWCSGSGAAPAHGRSTRGSRGAASEDLGRAYSSATEGSRSIRASPSLSIRRVPTAIILVEPIVVLDEPEAVQTEEHVRGGKARTFVPIDERT